jgi:hypothetical protein
MKIISEKIYKKLKKFKEKEVKIVENICKNNSKREYTFNFGGYEFKFSKKDIEIWEKKYPNIDLLKTFEDIQQWADKTSYKPKIPSYAKSFIEMWLILEENKDVYKNKKISNRKRKT